MSCGTGSCGCCPKCGCRATCTCNQSLSFDEAMGGLSYNVITVMASVTKCGADCGCATEGFSTGFFSEAAAYSAYYG